MKLGRAKQTRSLVVALAAVFTLMLLASTNASAQTTIKHVKVTLAQTTTPTWRAVYCDTGLGANCGETPAANGNAIWTPLRGFPLTGVELDGGDTLVLTQTGVVTTGVGATGGNFDSSDAVHGDGTLQDCQTTVVTRPCATKIEIDTGAGLVTVFDQASGLNPLTAFNHGPGKFPVESSQYQEVTPLPAAASALYTLHLGYADNIHGPCPAAGCFPSPFNGTKGTSSATVFVGLGANISPSVCPPGNNNNCFDGGALLITALGLQGRMTGGGSIFKADGTRVTHGFELHCNILDLPNNLEINWDGGNNFHLDTLDSAICTDDPKIAPQPPDAGFDTYTGTGTGSYNGVPGAKITFVLTDAGEPGTVDTAQYTIKVGATTVLDVGPANLNRGNQQAHKK